MNKKKLKNFRVLQNTLLTFLPSEGATTLLTLIIMNTNTNKHTHGQLFCAQEWLD